VTNILLFGHTVRKHTYTLFKLSIILKTKTRLFIHSHPSSIKSAYIPIPLIIFIFMHFVVLMNSSIRFASKYVKQISKST